jgi:hypothetical protein
MAQMVVTLIEGAIDHQRALAAAQPSSSVAAVAVAAAAAAAATPADAPPDAHHDVLHIGPTCTATLREHGGPQLNAPLYAESH